MFKRIMLGLAFVAAFSLVGVATPNTSQAHRYWRRAHVARYYGPPRVYYYAQRPVFPRYYYYGPPRFYGYPAYYYRYGQPRGVYFSFGF